jgi:hypothetical protein
MAFAQQQHTAGIQTVETIPLRIHESRTGAGCEAEAIVEQLERLDARELVGESEQHDVERSIEQLLVQPFGEVFVQKQLELGEALAQ